MSNSPNFTKLPYKSTKPTLFNKHEKNHYFLTFLLFFSLFTRQRFARYPKNL